MRPLKTLTYALPCLAMSLALNFAGAAAPTESPYSTPQPPFFGQVRTRTEYDSKDVRDTTPNHPFFNTQLRSRLGFTAVPSEKVEIKVEMQDMRYLGSEPSPTATNPATSTTGNLKGVDLLQGYFAIQEGDFKTAVGRQKMTLGAGRFLSTLEWSPTSRAFDGWSANYGSGPCNLTALAFLVRDTNATTTQDRVLLSGLYYSHQITPDIVGEAYSFYDQSRMGNTVYGGDTASNYDLEYFGERAAGKVGMLAFEEEFIWQMGDATLKGGKSLDNAAFQLATRLGFIMGNYKANIGVDMLSGDDTPGDATLHTYRANYYFAHALYGWMDYFVNNPRYGVIDYRVDGDFAFLPNAGGNPRVTLKPQYHFFTPQQAPAGSDDPYGQEFNLEAHLGFYPKSNIVLGAGYYIPGKSAIKLAAAKITANTFSEKNGYFLYLMPTFNF